MRFREPLKQIGKRYIIFRLAAFNMLIIYLKHVVVRIILTLALEHGCYNTLLFITDVVYAARHH